MQGNRAFLCICCFIMGGSVVLLFQTQNMLRIPVEGTLSIPLCYRPSPAPEVLRTTQSESVTTTASNTVKPQEKQGHRTCKKDNNKPQCLHMNNVTDGCWIDDEWHPYVCNIRKLNYTEIGQCLTRKNIRKIGIAGDSMGLRYATAVRSQFYEKCSIIKEEKPNGFMPDSRYYTNNTALKDVLTHVRDCHGCNSILAKCTTGLANSSNSFHSLIEYLGMEFTLDTEVTYLGSHRPIRPHTITNDTFTHQEFILKNVWSSKQGGAQTPDLILLFSTFLHDMSRKDFKLFKRDLRWFLDTLEYYLADSGSELYYFDTPRVIQAKMLADWRKINTNKNIKQHNDEFKDQYSVLHDQYPHVFRETFSVFDMSAGRDAWYIDGGHMIEKWYNGVVNSFISVYCQQ